MRPKSSATLGLLVLGAVALMCVPAQAEGVVSQCNETQLLFALQAGGTVTFSCSGTITLAQTIGITSDTTIDGTGQDVTISGGQAVQVFHVSPGVTLNLKELTIANGSADIAGGAIANAGTLTVTNCTFSGNHATFNGGGIQSFGTLIVTNSTFFGNDAGNYGGAIANGGALTVANSAFSGNSATLGGGGIMNFGEGTLTVTNSTFSSNGSDDAGGAISNGGTATVTNGTFSGNTSSTYGGGVASGGTLALTNSTFSANSAGLEGGGILNDGSGTLTLRNTVVADSLGGNCVGVGVSSDGHGNLSWPDSTCPGINLDPKLDPSGLLNNGGPTQTIALLPGSAAIDAAVDVNCPTTDQRGVPRPQGPHCDIGAFELVASQVQPPINADGSSIFSAKRGVVPVIFTLTQNGVATCSLPPATIAVTRTAGGTPGPISESIYIMSADTGSNFRIDPTACQYIYNLAASALGVGVYRVDISINGSLAGSATFTLK